MSFITSVSVIYCLCLVRKKNKVPVKFIAEIAEILSRKFAAVSIEVYPMDTADYDFLLKSGVTGIAVYQETYNREIYKNLHKGPKADFDYRLKTPERAGKRVLEKSV